MAPGEIGVLRVYGGLVEIGLPGYEVILGDLTDGRKVTICMASISNSQGGETTRLQEFDTYETLVGEHFDKPRAAAFDHVIVELRCLPAWVDVPIAFVDRPHNPGESWTLDVTDVNALTAQVPELGQVSLGRRTMTRSGRGRASVEFEPQWELALTEPMVLGDLLEEFVAPILFLMTLVTGERESVVKVSLVSTNEDGQSVVEWHGMNWISYRVSRECPFLRSPHIPYSTFAERFDQVVPNWFRFHRVAREAMTTYFSGHMANNRFAEDTFSNTVRSLEAWHRSYDKGLYIDETTYKALVNAMLAVLPEGHCQHFHDRLMHANEISLKKRVEAMVVMAGPQIAGAIAQFDKFARRVVDTRNAQAHRAELGDSFEPGELVTATYLLAAVLDGVIARQIGFTDADLVKTELHTQRWEFIRSGPLREN